MAAEVKEVVVQPHRGDFQDLAPDGGNLLFELAEGAPASRGPTITWLGSGSARRSSLPLPCAAARLAR